MKSRSKSWLILFATQLSFAAAALGATFTVTSTGSSGPGTLAQAILDANATAPGPNVIEFNIAGSGVKTITGTLPTVTRAVTINGYSQPGSAVNTSATSDNAVLLIQLSGCELTLQGGGSTVRGLVINGGANGITTSLSSNGPVTEPANTIIGNFIGTNATGTAGIACSNAGIFEGGSRTSGNQIGGTTPADRNVISGNTQWGIYARRATIQGNFIGTNAAGTSALPNRVGVFLWGETILGGTAAGTANVISGNSQIGVFLGIPIFNNMLQSRTDGDTVQGNFIGTAIDGVTAVPNNAFGIVIGSPTGSSGQAVVSNALIGGLNAGAGNVIAENSLGGVVVANTGVGNAILSNSIYNNKGIGIDLGNFNGPTANDAGDPDTGANNLQNFPVLVSASSGGGITTIVGSLNSTASSTFTLQFFATPTVNSGGNVEGKTLLGTLSNVTTDGSGNASFSPSFQVGVPSGQFVTATATSATNDTSEFSAPVPVNAGSLQLSSATYSVNEGAGTVVITVTRANGSSGSVSVHYATSNGSATAGSDYTETVGDLTFADGEISKTVNIPILEDSIFEGDETFNFTLSAATGGAGLGNPSAAVITIVENDVQPTPTPTPTPDAHLANIATRLRVETGNNVLIAGFIITGSGPKKVLIRGIGPSTQVPGALQDPTLDLRDSAGGALGFNNDWMENANADEIVATTIPPGDEREAALLTSLDPGSYTVILRGKDDTTGIGLVEVYDLETGAPAQIANISTRGFVQNGDGVMIAGLIITGNDQSQVVIRAIGPSLANFVPTFLADPLVELHSANGDIIFTNNNWRESQETAIEATGLAPTNELESAILISLISGNYTAIVKGADGGVGNGLVEVYKLAQ